MCAYFAAAVEAPVAQILLRLLVVVIDLRQGIPEQGMQSYPRSPIATRIFPTFNCHYPSTALPSWRFHRIRVATSEAPSRRSWEAM